VATQKANPTEHANKQKEARKAKEEALRNEGVLESDIKKHVVKKTVQKQKPHYDDSGSDMDQIGDSTEHVHLAFGSEENLQQHSFAEGIILEPGRGSRRRVAGQFPSVLLAGVGCPKGWSRMAQQVPTCQS